MIRAKRKHHVSVPLETYERLKAYAKEQGVTIAAVVEAFVADVGRDAKG